eukprot:320552-Chlamydomonas_euryale.AAC.37
MEAARAGVTRAARPRTRRVASRRNPAGPVWCVWKPVGTRLRGETGLADAAKGCATQSDLGCCGLADKRRGSQEGLGHNRGRLPAGGGGGKRPQQKQHLAVFNALRVRRRPAAGQV